MSTPSGNPFVFPGMGLGQTPEQTAGNPILQSLEMMRNAWSGMGGKMLPGGIPTPPVMNPEELDRRISELRTVENWLRLNLSMLEGTIQAMEVQRATISTLRSFATMGAGAMAAPGAQPASPLQAAFGMPGGNQPAAPWPQAPSTEPPAASATATPEAGAPAAPHQAWWNMLQSQFNQLASAAAATLATANPGAASAQSGDTQPADTATPAKAARKTSRPAARKTTTRKP